MMLQDGSGKTGLYQGVDAYNRGLVLADSRSDLELENQQGRVYAAPISAVTPTGAAVFAWLGNSLPGNISIVQIDLTCSADEVVEVHTDVVPSSALSGGTSGTVAPLSTIAPRALNASAASNTAGTVNPYQGSVVSGTNAGSKVGFIGLPAASLQTWKPPARIVLGPSKAIYLKTVTGGNPVYGVIYFQADLP